MRGWRRVGRVVWHGLALAGLLLGGLVAALASGVPIGVDRWVDVTDAPVPATAIVVLGGGTAAGNMPLPQAWERLHTAAELYADRYAPYVVLSGGGTSAVSEAEIYANAGTWLGIDREVMAIEPLSQRTADHGLALLGFPLPDGQRIGRDTPLLVVTSRYHSRRALLSFSRAGFTHVRIIGHYEARRGAGSRRPLPGSPAALRSSVPGYAPSGRVYDDVLFRLAHRSRDALLSVRELGAMLLEQPTLPPHD